jgi:hypothetical protein
MCAESTKLPVFFFGGDDGDDEFDDRLIQGGRGKWVDKVWTLDGVPPGEKDGFLPTGSGFVLQRWVDGTPEVILKEPGKKLPDPKSLNAKIPQEEWPLNKFTGQPEPPWKVVAFAYLLREHDAARFTHINSTWGTRICVHSIRERIRDMGALRGTPVLPIVRLTSAPMVSKKFPGRFRPEFEVIEWRNLGGNQQAQIEAPKLAPTLSEQVGTSVQEPTTEELFNDAIPDLAR